ncbi:MAG: 2-oxoacid:acceptor oxidoreductase subunit alpha [Candidatus Dojkabacteria bacterium]
MAHRFAIKFAGESGQGINTLGEILAKSIKNIGYHVFAYREYPSVIKGGFASYQIDFSDKEILSSSKNYNILASLSSEPLHQYLFGVKKGGLIVHNILDFDFTDEEREYIYKKKITVVYLDTLSIAKENNAPPIMASAVLLAYLWSIAEFDLKELERVVKKTFEKKNIDMDAEIRCLKAGYSFEKEKKYGEEISKIDKEKSWSKSKLLTANDAIVLGAISAGCRAYFAYPMTPSTSILDTFGKTYMETGIVVKQAESEITAIQLVMGAMYMGTRAFTATSGGGFDLMTETISCAGMTETPLVVVLGQRAGPATGVPTWSGTDNLDAALYSGHGDFPRVVLSCSTAYDAYELIQEAFNISEKYQLPVILLTEKQSAEALFNIKQLPKALKVERHLKEGKERYEITESGISPRWIPQKGKKTFLANSDEHTPDGATTEVAEDIAAMSEKRMRKLVGLQRDIPQPIYYGSKDAKSVFVGFGTAKNAVLDAMKEREDIAFLYYQYLFPLRYEKILELDSNKKDLILIENNQGGQFGELIRKESGYEFKKKLLKFDARPFFVEDILDFLKN